MPELLIRRKNQPFAPANCCFHVYIDGEKQTTLSNGDQEILALTEGEHTLQINNNSFKGQKNRILLREQKRVEIETYSLPILGYLYVLAPVCLIIIVGLRLFHVAYPPLIGILALTPLFLFIVLALFFGVLLKKAIIIKYLN